MTPLSESLLQTLRASPAEWVSNDTLAKSLYGRTECCARTSDRIRSAVRQLRSELPAGIVVESGVKLGYRVVASGRFE